jgi:hypothetical protein
MFLSSLSVMIKLSSLYVLNALGDLFFYSTKQLLYHFLSIKETSIGRGFTSSPTYTRNRDEKHNVLLPRLRLSILYIGRGLLPVHAG